VQRLTFDAMFVGGGSPNCLTADQFSELLGLLRTRFAWSESPEITVEWYPERGGAGTLGVLCREGVNRLSLGVQTLSPRLARLLGQAHTPDDSRTAVREALKAGLQHVNIDLLSRLPSETADEIAADIREAAALGVSAITVNPLVPAPGTPLYRRLSDAGQARVELLSATAAIALATDVLRALGYVQQRVYNFHLPGRHHRYNRLTASPSANILGIGPGAYGVLNGYAYVNEPEVTRYCQAVARGGLPVYSGLCLEEDDQKRSYLVTALLELSFSSTRYEASFGASLETDFGRIIQGQIAKGLLRREGEDFRLTDLGTLWGDNVCAEYFSPQQRRLLAARFPLEPDAFPGRHYLPAAQPKPRARPRVAGLRRPTMSQGAPPPHAKGE
jgi:oxygen-independent coproporphyrinogen-3 oxidase